MPPLCSRPRAEKEGDGDKMETQRPYRSIRRSLAAAIGSFRYQIVIWEVVQTSLKTLRPALNLFLFKKERDPR